MLKSAFVRCSFVVLTLTSFAQATFAESWTDSLASQEATQAEASLPECTPYGTCAPNFEQSFVMSADDPTMGDYAPYIFKACRNYAASVYLNCCAEVMKAPLFCASPSNQTTCSVRSGASFAKCVNDLIKITEDLIEPQETTALSHD